MKFSITPLALVFASAQASSLRLNKEIVGQNAKVIGSEVVLEGVVGEPTADDMKFIGQALVASYNNVHWEAGHFMAGVTGVDFNGAGVFTVKAPITEGSNSLLTTALTEECGGLCKKDASSKLDVNFCGKIRASNDSKFLSSAKSCAIRFDSPNTERVNKDSTVVGNIDSTIILKGAGSGDVTKEEQAIIAKAFVSAYNEVHYGENYLMTDAEIPFTAASEMWHPRHSVFCNWCPDDDALGGASEINTLVLDIVSPVEMWHPRHSIFCNWCPDDDATDAAFNLDSLYSTAFDKKAVEVAFCNKLQNSVSDKLASTKSCSIAVESLIAASAKSNTQ